MSEHYWILENRPDGETVMAGEAFSMAEAKRLATSLSLGSRSTFSVVDVGQQEVVCRVQGSRAEG